LRQVGHTIEKTPDRREIVRLVQGSEWNQLLECRRHARIDTYRSFKVEPAVQNAMSNPDEMVIAEFGAQKRHQVIERAIVAELRALGPELLGCPRPVVPFRDEVRCAVDAFDLAVQLEFKFSAARNE